MATELTGFNFFKTISGLFKILEIVLAIIAIICSELFDTSWSWTELAFFKVTILMGLIFALTITIFHLIHCSNTFSQIPWNKLDSVLSILLAVLLFISSSKLLYYTKPASLSAALVFSFGTAAVFILNSIYKIVFTLN